ncbi:MAG: FecR domain-containing protein [Oscillospiraceae bacterium]|nr:FecR domain-containing protein [Oscillospiraceae bacterium]
MKKSTITVIAAVAGCVLIVGGLILSMTLKKDTGTGSLKIFDFSNPVSVNNAAGAPYDVIPNMTLSAGYTIDTGAGGYARFSVDDGKHMRLGENSSLQLVNMGERTRVRLLSGVLDTEAAIPEDTEGICESVTPNAVISATNALFSAVAERDEGMPCTDVYVYSGSVLVHRIFPDGTEVEESIAVDSGCHIRIKTDDTWTVYDTDDSNESVHPIETEDIPDCALIDMFFASKRGNSVFLTEDTIARELVARGIDISGQCDFDGSRYSLSAYTTAETTTTSVTTAKTTVTTTETTEETTEEETTTTTTAPVTWAPTPVVTTVPATVYTQAPATVTVPTVITTVPATAETTTAAPTETTTTKKTRTQTTTEETTEETTETTTAEIIFETTAPPTETTTKASTRATIRSRVTESTSATGYTGGYTGTVPTVTVPTSGGTPEEPAPSGGDTPSQGGDDPSSGGDQGSGEGNG